MMTKKIKQSITVLLLTGCLAVSFTACLNDDNYKARKITPEEVQKAYNTVKGMHSGKLVYPLRYPMERDTQLDSVDVSWNVTADSVLIIQHMPAKAFAPCVQKDELKALLLKATAKDLTCKIGFYSIAPIAFVMQPQPLTYMVDNNGKKQKIEVLFYHNVVGSAGYYNMARKRFEAQLIAGEIRVDGETKEEFRHGLYMRIIEDKGDTKKKDDKKIEKK